MTDDERARRNDLIAADAAEDVRQYTDAKQRSSSAPTCNGSHRSNHLSKPSSRRDRFAESLVLEETPSPIRVHN